MCIYIYIYNIYIYIYIYIYTYIYIYIYIYIHTHIVVMNLISSKMSEQEEMMLYADGLPVIANSKDALQSHFHVVVVGKIVKQVDSFVYLGGTVFED